MAFADEEAPPVPPEQAATAPRIAARGMVRRTRRRETVMAVFSAGPGFSVGWSAGPGSSGWSESARAPWAPSMRLVWITCETRRPPGLSIGSGGDDRAGLEREPGETHGAPGA